MSFEENCRRENTCPGHPAHKWALPDSDKMVECINCGQFRNGGYIYLKNYSPLFVQKITNHFPFEFSSIHRNRIDALCEAKSCGFNYNDLLSVVIVNHYTSEESPTENGFWIPDWNTAEPYLSDISDKKRIQRIKFKNKCTKFAVFSTSEIQKFKGMTEELISTGLLEKALKQGYKVFVVTTRNQFRDSSDKWWQDKVIKVYTGYTNGGATDEGMISVWKQFYQDFGIDLNLLEIKTDRWTDYHNNLSRFGFKKGIDFCENGKKPVELY